MAIVSTYCKKGGVGKSTFIGYLAHYYSQQGKKVLLLSADDQNAIFKMFGEQEFIYERDDNYFEYLLSGSIDASETVCEARNGMYLLKTINTDALSRLLLSDPAQEKNLKNVILEFTQFFDHIFIDFSSANCRLNEVLLNMCDNVLVLVGLDTLGLDGYINTIQYFMDSDIDLDKITHIIPSGYHPVKKAPNDCLEILRDQIKEYTPQSKITVPLNDLSIVKNLQFDGVSIYDDFRDLSAFHKKNKNRAKADFAKVFNEINL